MKKRLVILFNKKTKKYFAQWINIGGKTYSTKAPIFRSFKSMARRYNLNDIDSLKRLQRDESLLFKKLKYLVTRQSVKS